MPKQKILTNQEMDFIIYSKNVQDGSPMSVGLRIAKELTAAKISRLGDKPREPIVKTYIVYESDNGFIVKCVDTQKQA